MEEILLAILSYYLENNEKFCSPVARTTLLTTIQDEIVNSSF